MLDDTAGDSRNFLSGFCFTLLGAVGFDVFASLSDIVEPEYGVFDARRGITLLSVSLIVFIMISWPLYVGMEHYSGKLTAVSRVVRGVIGGGLAFAASIFYSLIFVVIFIRPFSWSAEAVDLIAAAFMSAPATFVMAKGLKLPTSGD